MLSRPHEAEASLRIHAASGRLVASFFEGRLGAVAETLVWDGLDSRGRTTASGVYFVRAEVAGHRAASKVVVLR